MKLQFGVAVLTVMAFQISFCAADTTSTVQTEIIGNIGDEIDLVPPSNIGDWNLVQSTNVKDGTLHVTSSYYWGVNVRSDQPDGCMREYSDDADGGYITGGNYLHIPLHVTCTNFNGLGGHGLYEVQLTDQDKTLIAPGAWDSVISNAPCGIEFKQEVDEIGWHDARITTPGHRYHIVVTFTGYIAY